NRGTVGIAHSGKDSGGSQFFITHTAVPHLDARYTIFGTVLTGMEAVDKITRGDTIYTVSIVEQKDKVEETN
ncbi:MAG: peptidylprolyl isomerase, partial [candidate division Zixibacteria bacterium]|nr:peptidylprolyl isomerase [candidate division Zixibacteria bacterium]